VSIGDVRRRVQIRTHDCDLRVGPGEQEARIVGAAAHGVVARAVRGPHDDADRGHLAVGDCVDHLAAVLDDALLLVLLAHHEPRHVVQVEQRHSASLADLDELRGLVRRVGEYHLSREKGPISTRAILSEGGGTPVHTLTPLFARMPIGNPCTSAQAVTSVVP
jgi:hypothetical protein